MKAVAVHTQDAQYGQYLRSLIDHLRYECVLFHDNDIHSQTFHDIDPGSIVCALPDSLKDVEALHRLMPQAPLFVISSNEAMRSLESYSSVSVLPEPLDPVHFLQSLLQRHDNGENSHEQPTELSELMEPFLIGNSQAMRDLRRDIFRVGRSDLTALLLGQTGTGKGVVAFSLHNNSSRRFNNFMEINCANVPSSLLESELFGYKQGAFTGAWKDKLGKFLLASQGSIFLDEISEMPPPMQAKLLHVLQDGEVSPIGSTESFKVNVRIIAATNANIHDLLIHKRFREDLYYRLAVICISIPPLKERKQDIPLLCQYFLDKYSRIYNKNPIKMSNSFMDLLLYYNWPGNVRELENTMKAFVAIESEQIIIDRFDRSGHNEKVHLAMDNHLSEGEGLKAISMKAAEKAEREMIQKGLQITRGNKKKAAELLQISYKSLLNKVRYYGLVYEKSQ